MMHGTMKIKFTDISFKFQNDACLCIVGWSSYVLSSTH